MPTQSEAAKRQPSLYYVDHYERIDPAMPENRKALQIEEELRGFVWAMVEPTERTRVLALFDWVLNSGSGYFRFFRDRDSRIIEALAGVMEHNDGRCIVVQPFLFSPRGNHFDLHRLLLGRVLLECLFWGNGAPVVIVLDPARSDQKEVLSEAGFEACPPESSRSSVDSSTCR
jgi:hypothetical protein